MKKRKSITLKQATNKICEVWLEEIDKIVAHLRKTPEHHRDRATRYYLAMVSAEFGPEFGLTAVARKLREELHERGWDPGTARPYVKRQRAA